MELLVTNIEKSNNFIFYMIYFQFVCLLLTIICSNGIYILYYFLKSLIFSTGLIICIYYGDILADCFFKFYAKYCYNQENELDEKVYLIDFVPDTEKQIETIRTKIYELKSLENRFININNYFHFYESNKIYSRESILNDTIAWKNIVELKLLFKNVNSVIDIIDENHMPFKFKNYKNYIKYLLFTSYGIINRNFIFHSIDTFEEIIKDVTNTIERIETRIQNS